MNKQTGLRIALIAAAVIIAAQFWYICFTIKNEREFVFAIDSAMQNLQASSLTSATVASLLEVAESVRRKPVDGSYRDIERDIASLIKSDPDVDGMRGPDGSLINPFGGSIKVSPASVDGGNDNAFEISTDYVTNVACERIVRRLKPYFRSIAVDPPAPPNAWKQAPCNGNSLSKLTFVGT